MTGIDRFDDRLRDRFLTDAPAEAPHDLIDRMLAEIAATPQRGGGRLASWPIRTLAAAAVVVLAVAIGAGIGGLVSRAPGAEPSPTPSASAPMRTESASSEPPSATPSPSVTPTPAPATPAPTPTTATGLVLRVTTMCDVILLPWARLPAFTTMADGTIVWQTAPGPRTAERMLVGRLTPDGLERLRQFAFGAGYLDASATYELERRPDAAEPPGRGLCWHRFIAHQGAGPVEVRSVGWLGDEMEADYYEPSPERHALEQLVVELRDPTALIPADEWASGPESYVAHAYRLFLSPDANVQRYETADIAEIAIPYDGPIEAYGTEVGMSTPPTTRCGTLTREEAEALVASLVAHGFEPVGLDAPSFASLDWAAGNGTVDLGLLPVLPDEFPSCEEAAH